MTRRWSRDLGLPLLAMARAGLVGRIGGIARAAKIQSASAR